MFYHLKTLSFKYRFYQEKLKQKLFHCFFIVENNINIFLKNIK